MAAYLEFHVKGNGCAVVDAGAICAVIGHGHDLFARGTPESPTLVVFRGSGDSVEVIGESVGGIVGRMLHARAMARSQPGVEAHFDRITPETEGGADDAGPGESPGA